MTQWFGCVTVGRRRWETFPLVVSRRLPRMLTDRTADAFEVMLPTIRAVQATLPMERRLSNSLPQAGFLVQSIAL